MIEVGLVDDDEVDVDEAGGAEVGVCADEVGVDELDVVVL